MSETRGENYTQAVVNRVQVEIEKYLVGNRKFSELLLVAYLSRGHVLIEGPPGTGKTMSAKLIARLLAKSFSRIQFTSDMLPSDILGAHMYSPAKQEFNFLKGPIFADIVVADEINRTPPRTQSALLEAMEERQVTVEGKCFPLGGDFFVVATQNPEDYEGTFALPEVQLDRFLFKIASRHSEVQAEVEMLKKVMSGLLPPPFNQMASFQLDRARIDAEIAQVRVDDSVLGYIARLLDGTRKHSLLSTGSSVRGGIATARAARVLALVQGRTFVTPDDVKYLAPFTLGHRTRLNPEAQVARMSADGVVGEILSKTEFPA